jgi:hypothetical protein
MNSNCCCKQTKNYVQDRILEFIAIIGLTAVTLYCVVYLEYFFITPTPSYFYVGSRLAEIGIIPSNDSSSYCLGQFQHKVKMDAVPFKNGNEIYLPLKYVIMANGLKPGDVMIKNNIMVIKTMSLNNKYTVNSYTVNKYIKVNNEEFISVNDVKTIFGKIYPTSIEINGNKITLNVFQFPKVLSNLFRYDN